MKIYQIIYTSTAVTITGSSGFGVRTVSEGTPKEYIDLVNKIGRASCRERVYSYV